MNIKPVGIWNFLMLLQKMDDHCLCEALVTLKQQSRRPKI